MGVAREQDPSEVGARPFVDHGLDEPVSQSVSAVVGVHEDVGQVREPDAVGHGTGEPDLSAARRVRSDDPPRARDLCLDVGPGAPPSPGGVVREERPDRVEVEPCGIVAQLAYRPASTPAVASEPTVASERCAPSVGVASVTA